MPTALQKFKHWLGTPTDGHVIGLFRLVFGLFMVYHTYYYYNIGFISEGLLKPRVLFKFEGFEWVNLLPVPVMNAILLLMGVAAICMAAGVLFRWACWVFSLCLAFFFFQEKSYYNNHIYLFILVPLLLSATDADRFFSLRGKGRPFTHVPRWQQFILQMQILILYVYAGVVKFKPDWLFRQEPVRTLIQQIPDQDWLAPIFKHEINIYLFSYGGFLLDILAPFLLLYKPVRKWAWLPFILFHLSNSQLFDDIGSFPFVMLGSMILFFDSNELPILRNRVGKTTAVQTEGDERGSKKKKLPPAIVLPATRPLTRRLLLGYFVFQIVFPLRCFLLPNPQDYTTIANRFAWRVKADTRAPAEMNFILTEPQSGRSITIGFSQIQTMLNPSQIAALTMDPRAVRDFARYLQAESGRQGVPNTVVKARIRFGYNGRPPQFFIDPETDLCTAAYSPFKRIDWVVPVSD